MHEDHVVLSVIDHNLVVHPTQQLKDNVLIPLNIQLDSNLICCLGLMNNDKDLKSINFSAAKIRYPFIKDIGF